MSPDQWETLQNLFHLASETPVSDRERVLADACGDPEIRRHALAMVRAHERISNTQPAPPPPVFGGSKIDSFGPHIPLECIGTGGMGAVYLVEREVAGVRQRAALKVLAPHAASSAFVERFHREQHILASLDHPNITRMLDAGLSANGQPYLVMEFVPGQHLDVYCDQRRLTLEQRLQIFMEVCEAVDYAHRSLIVHLDLKPSNILVLSGGVPKLLDFGTSKLIPQDGRYTSTHSATPSYASPEQLRNQPVTTACDTYSLGVILFELLSGSRPSGNSSVAAIIEHAIEDREPARLDSNVSIDAANNRATTENALRAALAGDLSTIVRKCLSNRPPERYASVAALSQDIGCYLAGRPVLARPQTPLYLAGKFVHRNRGKLTAALVLVLALTGALIYAYLQQRHAVEEGARAARTQGFMNQIFRLANSNFSGKQVSTLSDFLNLGIKMAPVLATDKRQLAEIECSLAVSVHDSGNLDRSIPVFEKALADARAAGDKNTEVEALAFLTSLYLDNGKNDQAIATGRQAVERSHLPDVSAKSRSEAVLNLGYALVLTKPGSPEGLKLIEQASNLANQNNLPIFDRASVMGNLAWAYAISSRLPDAELTANRAIQLYRQLPVPVCGVALPVLALARAYRVQKRFVESEKILAENYKQTATCLGTGHDLSLSVLGQWGYSLVFIGRPDEAIAKLEPGLALARKTYSGRNNSYLSDILGPLGMAYEAAHRPQQAEAAAREMLALYAEDPENPSIAQARRTIGRALFDQHRYAEALPFLESADKAYASHAPNSLYATGLHQILEQTRAELAKAR